MRVLVAAVAALSAALALTACGGGGTSEPTTTAGVTATQQWASGVCTAVVDWKTELQNIGTTFKGATPSKQALTDAAARARTATQTLATTLKGLGKPDTQAGQQAKSSLDKLSGQLSTGAKTIEDAVAGASSPAGVLAAVSTVSSSLQTMGSNVEATVADLQQLDAQGELSKAFDNADSCAALRS